MKLPTDLSTKIAVITSILLVLSEALAAVKQNIIEADSLWQLIRDLIVKRKLGSNTDGKTEGEVK